MGFKCHNCKGLILRIPGESMRFKWKDKTHMCKVHVCETCWKRARSLQVSPFSLK